MTKNEQLEALSEQIKAFTNVDLFELYEVNELPTSYFDFLRTCTRSAVNSLILDTQARIDWNDTTKKQKAQFLTSLELENSDKEYFWWLTNYKPVDGLKWAGACQLMVAKALAQIELTPEKYNEIIERK